MKLIWFKIVFIAFSVSIFYSCKSDLAVQSQVSQTTKSIVEQNYTVNQDKLLEKRIIIMNGEINKAMANEIVSKMLYLNSLNQSEDIYLYINSPGGFVAEGMSIYDTIQCIKPDVVTINTGLAASMASFILAAGTKGKRFAQPKSKVMIHQAFDDNEKKIQVAEVKRIRKLINKIFARNVGQPLDKIEKDTKTDLWMSAQQAKEYGIVDQVVNNKIPKLAQSKQNSAKDCASPIK